MTSTPDAALKEGQDILGFRVTRVVPLPNQRSVAYQLEHTRTGARILHLHNDDAENLFSITFPTPPSDDTGVPHILEHAVLAGSKRFPVKDPFFEMIKQSMATFINAMTGSDSTYYPVCSNVRADYYNLAEVYWDAVFYPTLTEMTFLREGHHLEPADKTRPDGDLRIQGIVYNEMKGAFSSPSAVIGRASFRGLYPDTTYGKESGGDPRSIPSLTYAQFRDFHARFYHPSNAYIFLYGDIPTTDHLSWLQPKLDAFDRRPVDAAIANQQAWTEPREQTIPYPVAPNDPTAGKTWITINWLTGDGTDPEEIMAFSVIEAVLFGNQAAPLRKAIIDSKLGADLAHSGYHDGLKQSSFHVGLKHTEPQRKEAFVELVMRTLRQIVETGIEADRIDAAFQQLAYSHLEIGSNYPLRQLGAVKPLWLHGKDPLDLVRAAEHLDNLRRRYQQDPKLFTRLIQERILDNPHRLTLTFIPDPQMAARQEQELREHLKSVRSKLTQADLQRIAEQTRELDRLAATPNTPEAIATLPRLQVADLPRKPRAIPTTVEPIAGGVELLRNDVFANGVNYLIVDFDASHLPLELLEFLPLYGDCIRKMGAAGQSYVQIAERLSAKTGGISFNPYCTTHSADEGRILRRVQFGMKFVDANADDALALLRDLVFQLDVKDTNRLRDVLQQTAAAHRSAIVDNGLSIAQRHAGRALNPEGYIAELMSGLPQVRLITRLADHFAMYADATVQRLEDIRARLLNRAGMKVSFTGSEAVIATVRKTIESWGRDMRAEPVAGMPITLPASGRAAMEGLAGPMQVAFCSRVIPAPHLSHADAPLLSVGARMVSLDYVLDEIRFKGTAYGGGCGYSGSTRSWNFYSYRDPHVKRTLDVFDRTIDFVRDARWDQNAIDRAIIGTAKAAEKPIRPAEATNTALLRHLMGETQELRERFHAALLSATAQRVKEATLSQLEQNYPHGSTCVVSSHEKLSEAPLTVEEILTDTAPTATT
jgi:presequence protease